jgi:hypothetical protein
MQHLTAMDHCIGAQISDWSLPTADCAGKTG